MGPVGRDELVQQATVTGGRFGDLRHVPGYDPGEDVPKIIGGRDPQQQRPLVHRWPPGMMAVIDSARDRPVQPTRPISSPCRSKNGVGSPW